MSDKIKIMLVEDSAIVLAILKKILSKRQEIDIIATAKNGVECLEILKTQKPDVICTDLMMPVMDGLELTKRIMSTNPIPILVISSALSENETNVFQLLQAGALEVFPKPSIASEKEYDSISEKLFSKIKILKSIPVFKKTAYTHETSKFPALNVTKTIPKQSKMEFLVIGGSTGAPNAFQKILSKLPSDFPLPVICIQHISEGFIDSMVSWLAINSKLKIKIMEEGETPKPGFVYFPKNMKHIGIDKSLRLTIPEDPPYHGHIPSVNVAFQYFAKLFGKTTIAVILTGMGDDGANGILSIKQMGGITIGEDESTAVVYGMPRVAKELGALTYHLPLDKIPEKIISSLI
ncbi:MAG: chemotaxis protein CheB [Leptospiraceae bacterium]|nr:chemotaxis protein CheB [Leptospiraceae bacterium]